MNDKQSHGQDRTNEQSTSTHQDGSAADSDSLYIILTLNGSICHVSNVSNQQSMHPRIGKNIFSPSVPITRDVLSIRDCLVQVSLLFPFGQNVISLLHTGNSECCKMRLQQLPSVIAIAKDPLRKHLVSILSDEASFFASSLALQGLQQTEGQQQQQQPKPEPKKTYLYWNDSWGQASEKSKSDSSKGNELCKALILLTQEAIDISMEE